jgi:hypothetical protein
MRVVFDTGILIASLITADTPPDQICQAWRKRRFTLIPPLGSSVKSVARAGTASSRSFSHRPRRGR